LAIRRVLDELCTCWCCSSVQYCILYWVVSIYKTKDTIVTVCCLRCYWYVRKQHDINNVFPDISNWL